jgi:nucleotide-binding universal stress UspA family protein
MPARPIRRILVALDGSRFSEEALAPAMDLARSAGARLTLLEVVSPHHGLVRLLHPAARSTEAAEGFLRNVASRLPSDLGPVEVMVVEHASAAAGIIDQTRETGVDVIAMATHGRGGLLRFMLGSVAETVIRDSPVPVLVYRPRGIGVQAPDRSEALGSSL